MPILVPKDEQKDDETIVKDGKLTPEAELFICAGWGRCFRKLERVLKKEPDVNWRNEDGLTALHQACAGGHSEMCKRLLEAKADPNVAATASLLTPLDNLMSKIDYEEERDERLNDFDQVQRLDDTSMAIRPNLGGFYECANLLAEAGGVCCNAFGEEGPNIKPDGSVIQEDGEYGEPSEVRAYDIKADGSYTTCAKLRTGKYDILKYEDGMLVEGSYDETTGHFDLGEGMIGGEDAEAYDPALGGETAPAVVA